MTSVRALGKGGVSGKGREGKGKKLKEREQSVRLKDELRPCAPGTLDQSRRLAHPVLQKLATVWVSSLGLHTFPPADLKYFSLMMILKIRGYRLLYFDPVPLPPRALSHTHILQFLGGV